MGAWFLSFAIANYVGGKIAAMTGGHGGGEAATPQAGLEQYVSIFTNIGFILAAFAVVIILLNKPIQKLMHGVE